MKCAIIGTGYIGLPTGACFANLGHDVVCIDRDEEKIARLRRGESQIIYEEGLDELITEGMKSGKLRFESQLAEGIKDADLVLIAVGTFFDPATNSTDLSHVEAACNEVAAAAKGYLPVAIKSTVLIGSCKKLEAMMAGKNPEAEFDVISLPEFLREGKAVHDFFHPDRIIAGVTSDRAKAVITELYKPLKGVEPVFMSRESSEMVKFASNSFLAIKIGYVNSLADLCRATGATISDVAKGMGLDNRIGSKFLEPSPGYGGSCLPKDAAGMVSIAKTNGLQFRLVEEAVNGNKERKLICAKRIYDAAKTASNSTTPKIAILGLAFKADTDDVRDSPAIEIATELTRLGATVQAYDPKAMPGAKRELGEIISYANTPYEACEEANTVAILTEWAEFKTLNLATLAKIMQTPVIVDFRSILNENQARENGFDYIGI